MGTPPSSQLRTGCRVCGSSRIGLRLSTIMTIAESVFGPPQLRSVVVAGSGSTILPCDRTTAPCSTARSAWQGCTDLCDRCLTRCFERVGRTRRAAEDERALEQRNDGDGQLSTLRRPDARGGEPGCGSVDPCREHLGG